MAYALPSSPRATVAWPRSARVSLTSMVIHVSGDESTASQVRIYAEFRFFAALARHARRIRRVDVILRTVMGSETADVVTCRVDVKLEQTENICASATGRHACGAIDRAAERIGALTNRRLLPPLES